MNIDALIAEKVMGWKFWKEERGEYTYVIPQKPGDREPWTRYRYGESHKERYKQITVADFDYHRQIHLWKENFRPSTNIAHAHLFRDKVLAEHREWRVVSVASQSHIRDESKWFYVDVKDVTGRFISESGTHSTEPLALCLALLRALGVSEQKIKEAMDGKA